MKQPPAESAQRIRDRAEDVRTESKSLMRKARVLSRMAADLEEEAETMASSLSVARPADEPN